MNILAIGYLLKAVPILMDSFSRDGYALWTLHLIPTDSKAAVALTPSEFRLCKSFK
jgi:hypothetical protein